MTSPLIDSMIKGLVSQRWIRFVVDRWRAGARFDTRNERRIVGGVRLQRARGLHGGRLPPSDARRSTAQFSSSLRPVRRPTGPVAGQELPRLRGRIAQSRIHRPYGTLSVKRKSDQATADGGVVTAETDSQYTLYVVVVAFWLQKIFRGRNRSRFSNTNTTFMDLDAHWHTQNHTHAHTHTHTHTHTELICNTTNKSSAIGTVHSPSL